MQIRGHEVLTKNSSLNSEFYHECLLKVATGEADAFTEEEKQLLMDCKANDWKNIAHLLMQFLLKGVENQNVVTVVKFMLKTFPLSFEHKDKDGETPLMFVVRNGPIDIVKELIKAGADVNAKDYSGNTSLMIAARSWRIDIIKELIQAGANVDTVNYLGRTSLMIAAKNVYNNIVKELIEAGANVNAVSFCNSIDRIFVGRDSHPPHHKGTDYPGSYLSSYPGYTDIKKHLGYNALMFAVERVKIDVIEQLIKQSVDLSIQSNSGDTALMIAVRTGSIDVVQKLIKAGADVNAKNKAGYTPLTIARKFGYKKIAGKLIDAGAYVNVPNIVYVALFCTAIAICYMLYINFRYVITDTAIQCVEPIARAMDIKEINLIYS